VQPVCVFITKVENFAVFGLEVDIERCFEFAMLGDACNFLG
jgi:hypothetical protein